MSTILRPRPQRTANLLAAAALALTDLADSAVTSATGVGVSAAAALVVLATATALPVTELGRRVGLSQSAATHMVDALAADQRVTRQPQSGRTVEVALTRHGKRAAEAVLTARGGPLTEALPALDNRERATLARLLAKLLPSLSIQAQSADVVCRLCDRRACTTGAVCPIGRPKRLRTA